APSPGPARTSPGTAATRAASSSAGIPPAGTWQRSWPPITPTSSWWPASRATFAASFPSAASTGSARPAPNPAPPDPPAPFNSKPKVTPAPSIFGSDPKVLKDASPLTHVRRGLPPFLVMNAEFDYPPLARMGREFTAELKKHDVEVETKRIARTTHETMVFD